MEFKVNNQLELSSYDVVVLPLCEGQSVDHKELLDVVKPYLNKDFFEAKKETYFTISASSAEKPVQIILAGLGKKEEVYFETATDVIGAGVKQAVSKKPSRVAVYLNELSDIVCSDKLSAIAKVSALASYRFDKFLSSSKEAKKLESLTFIDSHEDAETAVERGYSLAQSILIARKLVDEPANIMKPKKLAEEATRVCNEVGIEINIMGRSEIEALNMNAFLSVAKGSDEEPQLIVMKHMGDPSSSEITALVGKGLTYDSGGYSIKPTDSMMTMKSDMGGSAAVIGAMHEIGKRKPKINVVGIVATCENMISGHAYLPGDILTSMSGKTIEVVNTDAEGRLTLADAITYAIEKEHACRIVDICTLTGAVVVALGEEYAGVITRDDNLWDDVYKASQASLEPVWRMPINKALEDKNKSSVADLKNSGGRWGGCCSAGAFVGAFAQDKPWIHLDIAGTAFIETEKPYLTKGGTGYGVHLLAELVSLWAK